MHLFWLLLIIYIIVIVTIIILFLTRRYRGYWGRILMPLHPCPFGNNHPFKVIRILGKPKDNIQGILSYSLYGRYDRYTDTLYKSLNQIPQLLPKWQARVYISKDIPSQVIHKLLSHGAVVYVMGPHNPQGHEAMMWRFLPAQEELPFVSLDADDVIDATSAYIIQSWIKSNQPFCILQRFRFYIPMMGGLWGSRNKAVPNIQELIDKYCEHRFGSDEAFLTKEIWPIAKEKGYWSPSGVIRLDLLILLGLFLLIILILWSLIYSYQCKCHNKGDSKEMI